MYRYLLLFVLLTGCTRIGVFEKNVAIKDQAWGSAVRPSVSFVITDTASPYNIYLVLRHTDAYRYNNIWLNISRSGPDTTYRQQVDIKLATNDKGWLGTGMDDIFEHRVLLINDVLFKKPGNYTFTLQQIMREDPLQHVLNAGIRVERVKT
ncbi:MAG TPA: gliding motility lipoprotein GldH [Chitinophagaceae bacterium]|nr:gliding motility lipoprotein GldH [Chitinophagaceae bacterium]